MGEGAALRASVDIAATPERVWSLVTDLPRMASWSPQVVRTFVWSATPVRLGSRAVNVNRRGLLLWPTRSTVVVFDPPREFAFRVTENRATWAFLLERTASGTRLVQERRTPRGIPPLALWFQRHALGGVESFTEELREGMRQTLARIKAEAEA